MCPPVHAEWGVCLLLEQVVCLTGTQQTAVCDESCRVGGEGGAGTEREVRGAYDGGGGVIWTNGELDQELDFNLCWNLPAVRETSVLCTAHLSPLPLPLPPSPLSLLLPAACLVLDGWRRQELQVGFERRGQ